MTAKFAAAIIIASLHLPAAAATNCLPSDLVSQIQNDFKFATQDKTVPDFARCDPENIWYKTFRALAMLQSFSAPAPVLTPDASANKRIMRGQPYAFFRSLTKKISFRSAADEECETAGAYVEGLDPVIYICPSFGNLSPVMQAAMLAHEARHIVGFDHIECRHGYFETLDFLGCDKSLAQKGGYGIGVEFDLEVIHTPNVDPILTESARAGAVTAMLTHFDQWPLGITEGALLQEPSGDIDYFNGSTLKKILNGEPDDILVDRYGRGYLYRKSKDSLSAFDVYNSLTHVKTLEEGRDLLDIIYTYEATCDIFPERLHCDDKAGGAHEIRLDGWRTSGGFRTNRRTAAGFLKKDRVYLADENGVLRALPKNFYKLSTLKIEQLSVAKGVPRIQKWITLGGQDVILANDGSLWKLVPGAKMQKLFPDKKFRGMIQHFWSPELQKL